MKKIFILVAAIATLASCAKENTISANYDAINFGMPFVDNSVRAADPSYSANDITKFNVYGTVNNVVIYPGTEVTKGDAAYGDAWTCGVNQYWIPGASYKFVGIVDGNVTDVTSTTLTDGMPTTISYTADGKTDLLCQTITKTANTDGNPNGLVAFTFTHLLSKVNFTVTNGSTEAEGYSFVVKNITFKGNTAGVYDVVNAKWDSFTTGSTAVGNERTVEVDGSNTTVKDIVVETEKASNELDTEVLFLPGTYTISFTVDILYNGTVITTTNYPATGTTYEHTLEAAKAYNFNVNVKVGELIKFTVTEQPEWDNDHDGEENTADGDTDGDDQVDTPLAI